MALYVNGIVSHRPLLGEAMAGGLARGFKGRQVYLLNNGIYWVLRLF
jgi:hypothetical protein